jgi:nonsense-mediated mRNA decay protein 3
MFCVECGKETSIYKNGVCLECYVQHKQFTSGPSVIDVFSCPRCDAFKYKNTWIHKSFKQVLLRHIKDKYHISRELKNLDITVDCNHSGKTLPCRITMNGFVGAYQIEEEHQVTVRLKQTICDVCSRQYGGYYEATLQIRAENRKLRKSEIQHFTEEVDAAVSQLQKKGNRGLFITDVGMEHGGVDFYLSERGSAYSIVKTLQGKYGGEIKQSSKNIGMKDSKQIYRMTYLLRLPTYRMGDFIQMKNTFYRITGVCRNRVHVLDLATWKETVVDGKALQHVRIFGGEELIQEMILVSQSEIEVQIMGQSSYKTFEIKKPIDFTFKDKILHVVAIDDTLFLVPKEKRKKG